MSRISTTFEHDYAALTPCVANVAAHMAEPQLLSGDSDQTRAGTLPLRSEVDLMASESEETDPPVSGERGSPPQVVLMPGELSVTVDGTRVAFTRTQFSIFAYFFENSGRWVTPNELIRHVLGTHHQPDTSLVRVHVHAIRRRLGRRAAWLESDPRRVRGYRWCGVRRVEQSGFPSSGVGAAADSMPEVDFVSGHGQDRK